MRGEGNHKIPGSFAPENMEKTGAERVKYSLACQHEDAIPIKFVSYAQKCPTVLCTFAVAVALRKESVSIESAIIRACTSRCRSPQGERARKGQRPFCCASSRCRSPQGERARNFLRSHKKAAKSLSLSARRACMPKQLDRASPLAVAVALRKESVHATSEVSERVPLAVAVALRKESVHAAEL